MSTFSCFFFIITTFYTSVQLDTEDIKYMSNIYVIMQQRKTCFIVVNMLFMKGGYFKGFQYKMCLNHFTLLLFLTYFNVCLYST